jgi:hypothetical protein
MALLPGNEIKIAVGAGLLTKWDVKVNSGQSGIKN